MVGSPMMLLPEADFSGIGGVTVRVRGDNTAGSARRATQE
jgi:hypothetical protein